MATIPGGPVPFGRMPRLRSSNHPGSKPCHPFVIIASAASFGSGHLANLLASNLAARAVSGFRIRWRCSITPSACSGSRMPSSSDRGVALGMQGAFARRLLSLPSEGGFLSFSDSDSDSVARGTVLSRGIALSATHSSHNSMKLLYTSASKMRPTCCGGAPKTLPRCARALVEARPLRFGGVGKARPCAA